MIELNKIYCESNLETMSRMEDNFIDLTVTSPPYDGLRDYNGYSFPFEDIPTTDRSIRFSNFSKIIQ